MIKLADTPELAGSPELLVLWEECGDTDEITPYYAISLDGQTVQRVRATSYELKLRYKQFDTLAD